MLPQDVTHQDFRTFVTHARFQGSEKIKILEKAIDEHEASKQNVSVIVVRGKQQGISGDTETNLPFQRVGKSDFLHSAKDILGQKGFRVIDFLSTREELVEGDEFYRDIFLEKLVTLEPSLWPMSSRIAKKTHFLSMIFTRLSLLITVALPSLSAVIVFSLGLLGFDFIEFAADTQNQNFILNILAWLKLHRVTIYMLVTIAFVAWILYAWGKVRSNGELYEDWQEAGVRKDPIGIKRTLKEQLAKRPQKILSKLCKSNSKIAFIIDDLDLLETPSFQLFERFYEQATKMRACSLLVMIAYNNQNPIIHQSSRIYMRDSLDAISLREKNWYLIELAPPTWDEVNSLLWRYYQNQHLIDLVDDLKRYLPELADNPGFFLPFFVKTNWRSDEIINLTTDQTLETLKEFQGRNREMTQRFLAGIKEYDPELAPGALELLKFVLAFKQRSIRIRSLRAVMEKKGFADFDKHLEVLLYFELGLLEKDITDYEPHIKFREPYYRSIITSGWADWQRDCDDYYSDVLHAISIDKIYRKEKPEIALGAKPSKLAIELLYRFGEYYYRYRAASYSDAGYALQFVGYKEDERGALAKWFKLFDQALHEGENLSELMEWRTGVRFNPYAGNTHQSYERPFFAPDLILLAGQLYRVVGQWQHAYTLWTKEWERILDKLDEEDVPSRLHRKIAEADIRIRRELAEMLFAVGYSGDGNKVLNVSFWEEAGHLLSDYRDKFPATAEMIRGLMRHYRQVGVGNLLYPYHFLTEESDLKNLEEALKRIGDRPCLEHIRLLYLLADEYWQIIRYKISNLDNPPNLLELDIEKIDRFSPEIETLINAFQDHIMLSYRVLRSFTEVAENQLKKQRGLPSDRILRGDILYWEAIHLLMVTRLFQIETTRIAGQFSGPFRACKEISSDSPRLESGQNSEVILLQSPKGRSSGVRNRRQRVDNAITIINTMGRVCSPQYTGQSKPPGFEKVYNEFEQLETQAQNANDDKLITLDFKLKTIMLPRVYKTGLDSLIDMTNNQLHLSEVVYRQLGYRSRVATTRFTRARLFYEFHVDPPSWLDEANYALGWSSGELGYHLDVLRNHLMVAQAAENTALHLARSRYSDAQQHLLSKDLRLPPALSSEVTFNVAQIIGSMEKSPFPISEIIHLFNVARNYYSQIDAGVKYVSAKHVENRRLDCHWWLAELHRRLADQEPGNTPQKQKYIERAIDEANYILKTVKNVPGKERLENSARIVLAPALYANGQISEALIEAEKAAEYFLEQKDNYNALQALRDFVWWLFMPSAQDVFGEKQSEMQKKYLKKFIMITDEQINNLEKLNVLAKIVLYLAISKLEDIFNHEYGIPLHLQPLAEILPQYGRFKSPDEVRLYWYNIAFDILETLGLYASAINLYEQMSTIYKRNSPKLDANYEVYKMRIVEAARKFDPLIENASYADFGWIIRDCTNVIFDPSEFEGSKREMLKNAQKAIDPQVGEIGEGITILRKAKNLIDRSNPEDIDVDILTKLRMALYQMGETEESGKIEQELRLIKSMIQSKDFLYVAEYLEKQGRDFIWALEIASKVSPPNKFSRRAKARLRELRPLDDEAEDVINVENEQELAMVLNDLLELPINELTNSDLSNLLNVLERELRKLIAEELSKKSSNWWRERIPEGLRVSAEERKKSAEEVKQLQGVSYKEEHPIEYLDFPHYLDIICRTDNWNDTFKPIFRDKERIRIRLQEINPRRNDVAHSRTLSGNDKDTFVVNARQILRQIYNYKNPGLFARQGSTSKIKISAGNMDKMDKDEKQQEPEKVHKVPQVEYSQSNVVDLAFSVFTTTENLLKFIDDNDKFKEAVGEIDSSPNRKDAVEKFVQACQQNELIEELIQAIKKLSAKKYGKWYAALVRKSKS